jgi:hypothetical protein
VNLPAGIEAIALAVELADQRARVLKEEAKPFL